MTPATSSGTIAEGLIFVSCIQRWKCITFWQSSRTGPTCGVRLVIHIAIVTPEFFWNLLEFMPFSDIQDTTVAILNFYLCLKIIFYYTDFTDNWSVYIYMVPTNIWCFSDLFEIQDGQKINCMAYRKDFVLFRDATFPDLVRSISGI